ncbi:uncharacterized protein Hap1MRO34_003568 [Clarias gariepinus]|uniref:uncharacterized protein LOC128518550 n=1 Tax=Clarias gariepinus TaxID=13013 RepID=UPI00234C184E|nr:uncharacterized protein LOC128518550 [Clarias gariepinus]
MFNHVSSFFAHSELQVRVSDSTGASEGQIPVTLSCITSCTLSNNPTYIWYKNGQRVTDKITKHNKLYLINNKDVGNYSCAVRGREDLRSPEQPVTLLGEGEVVAGQPLGPDENHHVIIAVGVLVCLSLIIIAGALWMCRKKFRPVKSPSTPVDPKPQSEQSLSHQDDVHYSSIHFLSSSQGSSLSPGGRFPRSAAEDECVQYAEVNIKRPTAAT